MRFVVFLLILTLISSCNWSSDENSMDSAQTAKNGDTLDPWNFARYLNSPSTPDLAKAIFRGTATQKDGDPTIFMDSLMSFDKEARPFYFRVITNSYSLADGAFAEALGAGGYNFVSQHFDQFSNYFTGPHGFSDSVLKTWANIVLIEFSLRRGNLEQVPSIDEYITEIQKRCNDCSREQLLVLDRLHKHMEEEWLRFLGEDPENAS